MQTYLLVGIGFLVTLCVDAFFGKTSIPVLTTLYCGIVLVHEFIAPYIKRE